MATSKDWRFLGAVTAAMTMTVAVLALSLAAPGPAAAGAFGEVDIEQVAEPAEFPYSTACFLRSTLNSGPEVLCSGVLIGPYHVLTAAHCVYQDAYGGAVALTEVFPGLDSNTMTNGLARVDEVHLADGWIGGEADDDDASGDGDDTGSDGCECTAARPSVSITPPLVAESNPSLQTRLPPKAGPRRSRRPCRRSSRKRRGRLGELAGSVEAPSGQLDPMFPLSSAPFVQQAALLVLAATATGARFVAAHRPARAFCGLAEGFRCVTFSDRGHRSASWPTVTKRELGGGRLTASSGVSSRSSVGSSACATTPIAARWPRVPRRRPS